MHHWVRADSSDFSGTIPQPRSGHTAVNVGNSKVVIFGGLVDKRFLTDITVFDSENNLWFNPECTGNGSDGLVGPSPRAFHVAVSIDCNMFIFGGRCGGKRLGDFWMLDTDIWQWSELTGLGDLPSPRDFASASSIGNRKIVLYGGWDGKKWLTDVYILDTMSLEWTELSVAGALPPPRCGHTATMVEKRLLVFGGRGGGGPIMGDLWALKGLIEEENETPGWTQLKLPGQQPSPRCGHSMTSGGHNVLVYVYANDIPDNLVEKANETLKMAAGSLLLLFGGHGTGGWLTRYDVYHNDCTILDRVSVQWKRLPTSNDPPSARAYHSMTSIGSRYLLFGGFDGKSTFGELWWLVHADDPIAKRLPVSPSNDISESKDPPVTSEGTQKGEYLFLELQRRVGISLAPSSELRVEEELDDKELLDLSSRETKGISQKEQDEVIQEVRDRWKNSSPELIPLRELGHLLRDYRRLIIRHDLGFNGSGSFFTAAGPCRQQTYRFFHIKTASQLRMADIPNLLTEYKQLLST